MSASPSARPRARRRDPRRLLRGLLASPPEPVADGVEVLRGGATRTMNVVLIDDPNSGGVVVFDTGEQGMAQAVLEAGRARGGIAKVVLGHGDTDHRGAAAAIARAGEIDGTRRIPVLCHADAVVQAEGSGGRDYWRTDLLPAGVRAFHGAMHHVWDGGPVAIDGTLADGDRIAGFEVVALPGHAPGLIALWRAHDRLALVSDAFYMTDMWGRPQDPALPLCAYNQDTEQARESLRRLAALDPVVVVPGHLGPLRGTDLRGRLERAADAPAG